MEIRRATIDDAGAIATVHVRSWQSAYAGVLPQSYLDGLDPRHSGRQWAAVLEATAWPGTGTLVLTGESGTVIGFAHLSPTRDDDDDSTTVGELQTLYLDPLVWRGGGGSVLLRAVTTQMAEAGFQAGIAWTLDNNERARSFYEHHGWAPDGATKLHDWGAFLATDVRYRVALL
ncbi:MAG TPA: GNAT family N-acetyltransferase [Acidimicrobiales bacterium]|nr:GNAT family N-acetyltransferase [Acidimicrobiales bacterium]